MSKKASKSPEKLGPLNDIQKVTGLVSVTTAGGTPRDVAEFATEHNISVDLIRLTADGLENNARTMHQAVQLLQPPQDDDEG